MVRSPPSRRRRRASRTTRERGRGALRNASRLLRVLVVHLLEERRGLDAPLLFKLDQLAGAMPFLQRLSHELAPRAVTLLELHREAPWLFQNGRQRHLEAGPFRIGEALGEGGVIIDPPNAVALL